MLYRRISGLLALMVMLAWPAAPAPQATAQAGERCFAETGHCIAGPIRLFWERNGGLPVFGLPLAPQQEERIEGRALQAQWFERARLELHPELEPPFDVQLGRLGVERLQQQGRDPGAFPRSGEQAGCRFFAETGQSVCEPVLTRWRADGLQLDGQPGVSEAESLALFGLPLSPLQEERLADGRTYQVQWFERARFELHPEPGPTAVLLGLLGSELRQGTPATPAPPPPAANPPLPPPDEVAERLRVPGGFAIRGFAGGLRTPRLMRSGPDGALYVAERGAGRIVRLPDRNRDGLADGVETVVDGLQAPHNMEWIEGCLYVAENHQVSRHCDSNGDGNLDQHGAVVALPTGGGHTSRTLHQGADGKLYVSVGSTCNVCRERDQRRAAILRFNLDGSIPADNPFANDPDPLRRPVWAEGLRNSIDFLFLPDGQLWANHNGRDNMISRSAKDDRPLEELIIPVQGGRHHGWPYCTSERPDGDLTPGPGPYIEVRDPSGDVPQLPAGFSCAQAVPAIFTALAHSAPIGMARYDGKLFPGNYQGDIYMALHGSWNRSPPAPCVVVRIVVEEGQPVRSEEFVGGFQSNPSQPCAQAWGRPAGVAVGGDGALYISDDQNGRIYRIALQ